MPVDSSIYQNLRPVEMPSMLDSATKAFSLSALANQQKKQFREEAEDEAVRTAFAKNTGADGQLNRQGVLSDLGRVSPSKMMQYGQAFQKQDAEGLEHKSKQLDFQINQLGTAAQLAMGAKDQPSYESALTQAKSLGMDVSQLPSQYDKGLIDRYAYMSTKASERLSAHKMEIDAQLAQQKEARDAKDQKLKTASDLRKERAGLPTTKATQDVSAAYNRMQEASKVPSAAGDLSLIFAYMKMLDPGSTVREGEFANAQNAGGIDTRVSALYNRVKNGERLTPEQRADFMNQASGLYSAQRSQQQKVDAGYGRLADQQGVSRDDVLMDFEANQPAGQAPLQGGVRMQGPDGEIRVIPQNLVGEAIAAGGKKVK